jgi:glutathione S-transferase
MSNTASPSSAVTLYWSSNSCSMASHLALEYVGAAYAGERVDFSRSQQRSEEFLRLNPKGRVPVLATAQGILTETPAILQYICQLYPAAGLAPLDDPYELARMNAFNSYLCSTVHVNHAHRVRGERWSDDPAVVEGLKLKVAKNMSDCFAYIERDYLQGLWVLGERLSTSDLYLFTLANWLAGDGVDVANFPKVTDHMKRLAALPAVAKVVARHAAPA